MSLAGDWRGFDFEVYASAPSILKKISNRVIIMV